MQKDVLDFVVEKTHELIDSPTCNSETRASAEAWLAAVGTEQQAAATETYIGELEADIMPIDGLIGFADSEAGAQVFGADKAKAVSFTPLTRPTSSPVWILGGPGFFKKKNR